MILNDVDGLMSGIFSKSFSVQVLCFTDSASLIRSSVLCLLLK